MELVKIKSKSKKRVGRGMSSGQGKTSGRGTKGQKSRSGHNIPKRFEGGQTPLSMRLPKLPGFKSHKAKFAVVTLDDISKNFKKGETVSRTLLIEKKLIGKNEKAKILKNGTLLHKVIFDSTVAVSKSVSEVLDSIKEKAEKSEAEPNPKVKKSQAKKDAK